MALVSFTGRIIGMGKYEVCTSPSFLRECPVCGFLAYELWHIPSSGENVCSDCFDHFHDRFAAYLAESCKLTDKAPVQ